MKNFEDEIEEMCGNCDKILDCNGKKKTIKECLKKFMCNLLNKRKFELKRIKKRYDQTFNSYDNPKICSGCGLAFEIPFIPYQSWSLILNCPNCSHLIRINKVMD